MSDAGTYSLVAENRNGHDSVDLDLIVLDEVHTNDCDMFLNGSLECTCNNRFRAECADQEHIKLGIQVGHGILEKIRKRKATCRLHKLTQKKFCGESSQWPETGR
jgi:hypothetical protein